METAREEKGRSPVDAKGLPQYTGNAIDTPQDQKEEDCCQSDPRQEVRVVVVPDHLCEGSFH